MASRIAPAAQSHFPKRKQAKSKAYLAFLHSLPCVVTGRFGVQACHVSFAAPQYGHYGRGKQTKAADRWALPMTPEQHSTQHGMAERQFWSDRKINPHLLCLVLWGLWSADGDDAQPECIAVIRSCVGQYGDQS